MQAAVDRGRSELGELRIVVNCAGVGTPARVVGKRGPLDLDAFRSVVEINLVGTFNVLRLAAAAMLDRTTTVDGDRGVIVMTASIAAYDGQVGQAAYAASKGGVVGLTLSAARDLADKHGIRVVHRSPPAPSRRRCSPACRSDVQSVLEAQVPHPSRLGLPERVRLAGRAHRGQPDAQRRGHPPRRRAADASALSGAPR